MARKTTKTPATKAARAKTVLEDNFVAPKRKPKAERAVTLAEALAESGQTMAELTAPATDAPKAERTIGQSNLACTIRRHRKGYTVALRGDKKTQNNGDAIATMLLPVPFEALQAFSATRFGKSYDHLNPGHARMCIGNLMRGAVSKGEADVLEWLTAQQPKAEA